MPLQATSGAASYDGFGGGVPIVPEYIEDMFSTYLFTGNGTSQTITNNIDLSTEGGLVWFKGRNNTNNHALYDTARGTTKRLSTSQTGGTGAQVTDATSLTAFNNNGFSIGSDNAQNENALTFASWTFRKQPKFFDVVTWTGNGTASRAIPHNLGSAPGMMIVKQTDGTRNWPVYHRSVPTGTGYLNTTQAFATGSGNGVWGDSAYNNIAPTSTVFYVGSDSEVNGNGLTYVAYLFAHDAGGFGLTGTDNVISCGSFTTDGSGNATVNLGYEPQWILMKLNINGAVNWVIYDIQRGWADKQAAQIYPNITQAEDMYFGGPYFFPTATGFTLNGTFGLGNNQTNAYIAIRRGPMRVPTVGTSVFNSKLVTATQSTQTITGVGFSPDMIINGVRSNANYGQQVTDRVRGIRQQLFTEYDSAENTTNGTALVSLDMDGFTLGSDSAGTGWNAYSGYTSVKWSFKRAAGFFDVVCYTGTGVNRTVTHNLGVAPELMITKSRSGTYDWAVYAAGIGNTKYGLLSNAGQFYVDSSAWNDTSPTSSVFTVGTGTYMNGSGGTYVAYLFASCAGVSKVGSYTGTGTTLQINCGFTAGARFVLIKRTDSTGDWYVWDTVRGIVSGNDPYLLLNSASVEVTNTDYIDTYNAGFELSSTAPAALNSSGGTFIFLAIA